MENCKDFVDYLITGITIVGFFIAPYIGLAIMAKLVGAI
jgi:hypothetical protein